MIIGRSVLLDPLCPGGRWDRGRGWAEACGWAAEKGRWSSERVGCAILEAPSVLISAMRQTFSKHSRAPASNCGWLLGMPPRPSCRGAARGAGHTTYVHACCCRCCRSAARGRSRSKKRKGRRRTPGQGYQLLHALLC